MLGVAVAHPDITLTLDNEGVIRDVTLSSSLSNEPINELRGRNWADTVGESGAGKIHRMFEDARRNGFSGYSQFTQAFPSGLEIPMEYNTVRLGGQEGLLAIGRGLQAVAELQSRLVAAQQAMEQDYWKLREVETRYRMLFDASHDPVLIVRVDDTRVIEANPAAIRALGLSRGRELLPELEVPERETFQAMLRRVRDQGRAPSTIVHLGADRRPWTVRASLMSSESGQVYLLQIAPALGLITGGLQGAAGSAGGNRGEGLDVLVDRIPDGFVVLDESGSVRYANKSFLDLVQVAAKGAVIGEKLGRWLSRPGADAAVLLTMLQRSGAVRRFETTLQGEFGTEASVEISAASLDDQGGRRIGLVVRDTSSRQALANPPIELRTTLSAIIAQTGKTSLPRLISDATAMVERHCIESALELSKGSRTDAAELLGISRQALYKKLSRYEISG